MICLAACTIFRYDCYVLLGLDLCWKGIGGAQDRGEAEVVEEEEEEEEKEEEDKDNGGGGCLCKV